MNHQPRLLTTRTEQGACPATFRETLPQVAIEPPEPFRALHNQIRAMALRGAEDLFSTSARAPGPQDSVDPARRDNLAP